MGNVAVGMEDEENMSEMIGLKAKLGMDVFKEDNEFHIKIVPGREKDPLLKRAVIVCPAGLYSETATGEIVVATDGCLECGTCLLVCGEDVLEWSYPSGGSGVQFRFG